MITMQYESRHSSKNVRDTLSTAESDTQTVSHTCSSLQQNTKASWLLVCSIHGVCADLFLKINIKFHEHLYRQLQYITD